MSNEYKNYHRNVKIICLRHGESTPNRIIHDSEGDSLSKSERHVIATYKDPKLTERGHIQAQKTSEYLIQCLQIMKPGKVRVLISPYQRTLDTSQPFVNSKVISYSEVLPILREYTEVGKATDEHIKKGLLPDEDWISFQKRIIDFTTYLKHVVSKSTSKDIIVIYGHSLFFSAMLSYVGSQETWLPSKSNIVYQMPNCSITTIGYDKRKWSIYGVGHIQHLGEDSTGTHVPIG